MCKTESFQGLCLLCVYRICLFIIKQKTFFSLANISNWIVKAILSLSSRSMNAWCDSLQEQTFQVNFSPLLFFSSHFHYKISRPKRMTCNDGLNSVENNKKKNEEKLKPFIIYNSQLTQMGKNWKNKE